MSGRNFDKQRRRDLGRRAATDEDDRREFERHATSRAMSPPVASRRSGLLKRFMLGCVCGQKRKIEAESLEAAEALWVRCDCGARMKLGAPAGGDPRSPR